MNTLITKGLLDVSLSSHSGVHVVCWNDWSNKTGGQSVHRFKFMAKLKSRRILKMK